MCMLVLSLACILFWLICEAFCLLSSRGTGVSFDLSDRELFCIEDQDVFDRVYSLVRSFFSLPPSCKCNLVESLRSNLSVLLPNVDSISRSVQDQEDDVPIIDRITSHRNALKIYTFFLLTIIMTEESHISSVDSTKVFSLFFQLIVLQNKIHLLLSSLR